LVSGPRSAELSPYFKHLAILLVLSKSIGCCLSCKLQCIRPCNGQAVTNSALGSKSLAINFHTNL